MGGDLSGAGDLSGTHDEGSDAVALTASFTDIAVNVDPSASFDATTELPEVVSAATAVANNQSLTSDVSMQLHDTQVVFGGFNPESSPSQSNALQNTGNTGLSAALAMVIFIYPAFALINSGNVAVGMIALVILVLPQSCAMALSLATLAELFSARVRYSGMALGFNLGAALAGGTAPLICTWLIEVSGNSFAPSWFLFLVAAIGLATTFTLKETKGTALRLD